MIGVRLYVDNAAMRAASSAAGFVASPLPSVDRVMRSPEAQALVQRHGRSAVLDMLRRALAQARAQGRSIDSLAPLLAQVEAGLAQATRPTLGPVFNLSGTVLHTNLGRAALPQEALDAMLAAARGPVNLEYDLAQGGRGERDDHLEPLLRELTGAQAATVVNNNAAAVLLAHQCLEIAGAPLSGEDLVAHAEILAPRWRRQPRRRLAFKAQRD